MPNPTQKFYSETMEKGCSVVAFYVYDDLDFGDPDVQILKRLAHQLFCDIPWQMFGEEGKKKPLQLFVWVDVTNEMVDCGIALTGDQVRCGHLEWKRCDGHRSNAATTRKALRKCAAMWRERPDNCDNISAFSGDPTAIS